MRKLRCGSLCGVAQTQPFAGMASLPLWSARLQNFGIRLRISQPATAALAVSFAMRRSRLNHPTGDFESCRTGRRSQCEDQTRRRLGTAALQVAHGRRIAGATHQSHLLLALDIDPRRRAGGGELDQAAHRRQLDTVLLLNEDHAGKTLAGCAANKACMPVLHESRDPRGDGRVR